MQVRPGNVTGGAYYVTGYWWSNAGKRWYFIYRQFLGSIRWGLFFNWCRLWVSCYNFAFFTGCYSQHKGWDPYRGRGLCVHRL